MKVTPLKIPEIKLIEPDVFEDERGFFFESFNQKKFNEAIGKDITFVQDNVSRSKKGVLRGMHYQRKPFSQGKLIHVNRGEIFDVALDIRNDSPYYGEWVSEILSADNKKQLWIPEGFAHGFLVLSEHVEFLYKTTNFYKPEYEIAISWDDPDFGISWPESNKLISDKDQNAISFDDFKRLGL